MARDSNPFEYDAANNLPVDDLLEIFVEDHNFSRFICAPRNVFLVGERGSGKSMTLRFNSFPVQAVRDRRIEGKVNTEFLGVLIECNAPLFARNLDDSPNLDDFTAQLISEHLFVADIGQAIIAALEAAPELLDSDALVDVQDALSIYYSVELDTYGKNFLDRLKRYFMSMSVNAQKVLNSMSFRTDYTDFIGFSSSIVPLLEELRRLEPFRNSHFMLMVDDAQNLSKRQRRILNSWIAYRSQTLFSFKVGAAKSEYVDYLTNNGAPILRGHDFITLDMEQPFQNPNSDFAKFSEKVIAKRLNKLSPKFMNSGLEPPELVREFFPQSPTVEKELQKCRDQIEQEYVVANPKATQKQINDWGYKYGRVRYFRDRHAKANLPSYSGFDTIAHASTGVIRGLLEPCYFMYENAQSLSGKSEIEQIPPDIQSTTLKDQSDKRWLWVSSLHKNIRGCTEDDANDIYKLLESLGNYFQLRLKEHKSEPRILAFTISAADGVSKTEQQRLSHLFQICRAARLMFVRRGVSRDKRRRETYYVPDRLLWPSLGLDLIGQHGRASIQAKSLIFAIDGKAIPAEWAKKHKNGEFDFNTPDLTLFDE